MWYQQIITLIVVIYVAMVTVIHDLVIVANFLDGTANSFITNQLKPPIQMI